MKRRVYEGDKDASLVYAPLYSFFFTREARAHLTWALQGETHKSLRAHFHGSILSKRKIFCPIAKPERDPIDFMGPYSQKD